MKGKTLGLFVLLALSTASALTITINGKPVPGQTITVGGKTYVPLDALKAGGLTGTVGGGNLALDTGASAAGGSNQVTALQGCLNQTLFNGVWRVKFGNLRLATVDGTLKWNIDAQISNGTNQTLSGLDGALFADDAHLSWVLADGSPMSWGTSDALNGQKFTFLNLPPAGVWKGTLTNVDFSNQPASEARRPTKLLWQINNTTEGSSSLRSKLPWAKNPSFRIDLTCTK